MHAEAGAYARDAGIGRMFTLGDLSARASLAFGDDARHFSRIEDLLAEIENVLAPGVTMLVKGSRFMQMERVVGVSKLAADIQPAGMHKRCC